VRNDGGSGVKVQIPDNFEESDATSDSFAQKLFSLAGLKETDQSSRKDHDDFTRQIWCMNETNFQHVKEIMTDKKLDISNGGDSEVTKSNHTVMTHSPKIFMTDDNIINTQESVDLGAAGKVHSDIDHAKCDHVGGLQVGDVQEQGRRRSERLKKDNSATTMEKVEVKKS